MRGVHCNSLYLKSICAKRSSGPSFWLCLVCWFQCEETAVRKLWFWTLKNWHKIHERWRLCALSSHRHQIHVRHVSRARTGTPGKVDWLLVFFVWLTKGCCYLLTHSVSLFHCVVRIQAISRFAGPPWPLTFPSFELLTGNYMREGRLGSYDHCGAQLFRRWRVSSAPGCNVTSGVKLCCEVTMKQWGDSKTVTVHVDNARNRHLISAQPSRSNHTPCISGLSLIFAHLLDFVHFWRGTKSGWKSKP